MKKSFIAKIALLMVLVLTFTTIFAACGEKSPSQGGSKGEKGEYSVENAPEIPGLTCESVMDLEYAKCFEVYYYNDGFKVLDILDGDTYLVVPEGKEAPEGLSEDIVVLYQPLDNIYLAATSAYALFNAMGANDNVKMCSLQKNGWYIDAPVKAMEEGKLTFAGKYSEPDYEMLINEGCDVAIESTMIYHTPKVKEMIEDLGIPVFVDRSSYEEHPLGRTEWIKLYAAMVNKEDEAAAFFKEQTSVITELQGFENTGKKVVIFYVSTDGTVVIRNLTDYMPKMIEIAGGVYSFADLKTDVTSSSVSLSMEEFYATAIDADYVIYNASIDASVTCLADLIAKDELFGNIKGVKEGKVYTTGKSFYQATDIVGQMIKDVNIMLTDGADEDMTFLTKLN